MPHHHSPTVCFLAERPITEFLIQEVGAVERVAFDGAEAGVGDEAAKFRLVGGVGAARSAQAPAAGWRLPARVLY